MVPPQKADPLPGRSPAERCRLIFEGQTDPRFPREIVLERLRRLLKDSPEAFARRMARMPLTLLSDTDPGTARGYQRLLAQKGVLCRIAMREPDRGATLPLPKSKAAATDRERMVVGEQAPAEIPLNKPQRHKTGLRPLFRLGIALCFNPRGVIGRVLSSAPYRATLILAAGVGLVEIGGAMLTEHLGDVVALLLTFLAMLILAPALGIVFVYVRGFLLHAAGRLLKGRASPRELRVALAWSEIPLLLGGLLALLQFGMGHWGGFAPAHTTDPGLPLVLNRAGFGLLQAALGFWALGLLLHTIAEIQGFSLYRSLANIVLAAVVVLGPLAIIGGVLIGTGLWPLR